MTKKARFFAVQVLPAAADPANCALTLPAATVTAGAENLPMRLALADSFGNVLSTAADLAATAQMTLHKVQQTASSIKAAVALVDTELDIVPEASDGSAPAAAAAAAAAAQPGVVFEGTGADAELAWTSTLTAAGTHSVSVEIGGIEVAGGALAVTVQAAAADAAASRLLGPANTDALSLIHI